MWIVGTTANAHEPAEWSSARPALYGDVAYPLSPYLQKAYQGAHLTPVQQQFNAKMSSARIAVEWAFGEVATTWANVDMKKQQKFPLQSVALYYRVTALLSNLRTILRYGNKAAEHFVVSPPTLERVFAVAARNILKKRTESWS